MVSKVIEVEVDLDEFDTQDLVDEIESRGENPDKEDNKEAVLQLTQAIFEARRKGNNEHTLNLVDDLIYASIGRIV